MEWRDRRHSFVDVLERVTDGVQVAFVDRAPAHRDRHESAEDRPPPERADDEGVRRDHTKERSHRRS